ncbi:hypothetical protein IWX76_000812 [Pedobacter sp. CAN_A7]|uniref:HEAT repeat domain-containing protein n=1 Tax=Pedobacter sp. CAN_A7 TaxID=2787722 RepID=UPI0018CA0044
MVTAYKESRVNRATTLVSDALIDNLMLDEKAAEKDFLPYVDRINSLAIKSSLFNQVVIDQIIYYHRNFTDSTERILKRLFSNLQLSERVILKLKSGSWELQAKGLREMREMKPDYPVDQYIDPILNDQNDDLRIEAQSTYLKLHKNNPFGFLAMATEELLPWHQILLYEIIINTPDLAIPELSTFLKSKNTSVISFSIKLADYYQQLETIPDLIALLDHPDQQIRVDTINVLGKFNAEEAEPYMLKNYPEEELHVQLQVLQSIGLIRSGNQLGFLIEQFVNATEFSIVKTAGCALVVYPEFNTDSLINDPLLSEEKQIIISHCANTLIRN